MESLKGIQNIVSVEDYKVIEKTDTIGWDIYIRMELLVPFNTYICDKVLTEEEVIKLGCDICTALEICGQRNIIHRDIKPENIFINDFMPVYQSNFENNYVFKGDYSDEVYYKSFFNIDERVIDITNVVVISSKSNFQINQEETQINFIDKKINLGLLPYLKDLS
jgi:serine/threonine protein kinase